MAVTAAVATPPPRKRKATSAPNTGITPSPLPISKRARHQASSKTDEEKVWENIVRETDASSSMADSRPASPAPSLPFTDMSVAETTFTSASGSRKRPKKYKCEIAGCGKAFDRPIRLQVHVRSHTGERPYACEEDGCDKTFLKSEHLKRHMKDKHSEEKNYICTYIISTADDGTEERCGKSFTTGTRLRRHAAAHEEKEETKCQEPGCGKVFRKQETLQRHIRQDHLGEKAYQCTHVEIDSDGQPMECQQAFAKPEQLKNHEAREHSGMRYFCEVCCPPREYDQLADEMAALAVDGGRVGFPTYTDLQDHMHTAHPPTCPDCGKQCESNRALRAHIDIDHSALSERQNFKCTWPGCDRGFTKAGNLKVHVQNVHAKARNFICGQFNLTDNEKVEGWNGQGCGNAFGTKANLEEHIRTQHLGLPSKIKPCRRNKKAGESSATPSSIMDLDELDTPDGFDTDNNALSMLTGFGYAEKRNIACLVVGCQVRFTDDYHLAEHLELTHGWHVDDVNDRIAEKQALEGGQFWIGGASHQAIDAEDELLRVNLEQALRGGSEGEAGFQEVFQSAQMQDDGQDDGGFHRQMAELQRMRDEGYEKMYEQRQGITVNGMLGADGEAMVIDPALTGS